MKIPKYLAWLRQQRCHNCGSLPSDYNIINPHHCGRHGTAKRNHDEECIPLCFSCHRFLHDGQIKIQNIIEIAKSYYYEYIKKTIDK